MMTEYHILSNGLGTEFRIEFKLPDRTDTVELGWFRGAETVNVRGAWVLLNERWSYSYTGEQKPLHIEWTLEQRDPLFRSSVFTTVASFQTCSQAKIAAEAFIDEQKKKHWSPVPNNDCNEFVTP